MARSKSVKNMSKGEIREAKSGLKAALREKAGQLKPYDVAYKAATKEHDDFKKKAERHLKKLDGAVGKAKAKRDKAVIAADIGIKKINGKLAELDAAAA